MEEHRSFGGRQQVWQHSSKTTHCPMRFGVYLPPQAASSTCHTLYFLSGLTCTEQNVITKGGFQAYAAKHGLIVICPDTSPRGDDIADDGEYDLGQGAGFYINATESPWSKHYQMYDYIHQELPALVHAEFPTSGQQSIFGHSMGGHGALIHGLKNPDKYTSISAFAPIVAPTQVPWGHKAFTAYLGENRETWTQWDACELATSFDNSIPILVDQGDDDQFFKEQLQTWRLEKACENTGIDLTLRMHKGYDHSYYTISSFMPDHIEFHAQHLATL